MSESNAEEYRSRWGARASKLLEISADQPLDGSIGGKLASETSTGCAVFGNAQEPDNAAGLSPIERPIIFSGVMVRAILDSRKTQTRRIARHGGSQWNKVRPGDLLWVRERFKLVGSGLDARGEHLIYDADGAEGYAMSPLRFVKISLKSIPSIHMPRWASRITLAVTAVRRERLQDISETDAIREGAYCGNPIGLFRLLWCDLHGPGSWDANPEVVVIGFLRVKP